MKKILVLLLILCYSSSFSQESCTDAIFYQKSLNKLLKFTNSRHVVEFNYKMSESLRKSVFNNWQFSEEDKPIVKEALLNNNSYSPCKRILEITSKLKQRPSDGNYNFTSWKYSKPIFVSDNKVYLFSDILLRNENYNGVRGGSSRVQIFEKKDGIWKMIDKKSLEYY